jgi:hypothetical protein
MKQYHQLIQNVLDSGEEKKGKNGDWDFICFWISNAFQLKRGVPFNYNQKTSFKKYIT